jgi:acyl-CoA oxidase
MARVVDARTQQLQAPSTALVTNHAEDPKQDIVAERRRASFNTNELLYWLNGGREKVERRWAPAGNPTESLNLVGINL